MNNAFLQDVEAVSSIVDRQLPDTSVDHSAPYPGGIGATQNPFNGVVFEARYGVFDIADSSKKAELERWINNTLDPKKRWVLAMHEMKLTEAGDVFVAVKVLVPRESTSDKNQDEKMGAVSTGERGGS